jgi:hypothetical protein
MLGIQGALCHLSRTTAASSYAGGRPGSECAARHERSNERGRGAAGSPDPYLVQTLDPYVVKSPNLYLVLALDP